MSMTQHWLQSMSFRDLLEEELWWRNERLNGHDQQIMPVITKIQAEIKRRIQKG